MRLGYLAAAWVGVGLSFGVGLSRAQEAAAPATQPTTAPIVLPGNGVAEHPFIYCGQTDSRKPVQTIYIVKGGKVVWTYEIPNKDANGAAQNIADLHMLSNGNVLFAQDGATEVTQDKKVVWSYDCPKNAEVHSVQPIGLDKVFIVQPTNPVAKVMLMNKKDNSIEMEHDIQTKQASPHGQLRHGRITPAGTYLIAHMDMGKVVEYDKDWKEIWSFDTPSPWGAVRLKDGNTLISGNERGYVREVNPAGKVVWEITKADFSIPLHCVQMLTRLSNGDTLICNWTAHLKKEEWPAVVQVIEVNPAKQVTWAFRAWDNPDLGPCSCIQLLDEPGADEKGEIPR